MVGCIRILHVLTAMNFAGTETLLMNFYRNIDRSKVQFDFAVSATCECAYDREIESLGGRIIKYPRYRGYNDLVYRKWWKEFFANHSEYHIVHGHIGSTAAIYLEIAKKNGRVTIAHSHSTKSTMNLYAFLYQIYSYPTRFIADYFFGCSKKALIDRYGKKVASRKNSQVINNAIDTEKFIYNIQIRERMRKEYRIDSTELILTTVGRLTPQKNPYEIIEICKQLKKRKLNFKFLWFGIGEMYDEIREKIREEKVDEIIQLMGTRSDIYNVLQMADIFLFPSVWEGLGISCIEAQAAGLPTLCSDTIPIEARVSECCIFLPLNNTNVWCDEIMKTAKEVMSADYYRPNTQECIKKAGFDVKEVATWLQRFYLGR